MDIYERNLQKRREIENGLLELLQTMHYSQITVTRLTEHLNTSRKSFYHYYPNLEACLEALMDRMIVETAIHVTSDKSGAENWLQPYTRNLEYWKQHADFLNVVAQSQLEAVLIRRYLRHHMSEDRNVRARMQTEDVPVDEDVLFFLTSSIVGLIMRWCRRGFDTPVEEMAKKFHRLLRMPLIHTEEP